MITLEVNGTELTARAEGNILTLRTGDMQTIVRRLQARRLLDAAAALLEDDHRHSTEFEFLHDILDELPHEADRHCLYCACSDTHACELEGGSCGWHVYLESYDPEVLLGVCTNPECIEKHERASGAQIRAATG